MTLLNTESGSLLDWRWNSGDEMKLLLISDTHGRHLDLISVYGEKINADLCIHAGDFGFYDVESAQAFSQRELSLLIKHSDLDGETKEHLLKGNDLRQAVQLPEVLGTFPDFLDGRMRFSLPVFAVWGNHDDSMVIQRLLKTPLPNLQLLHDTIYYDMGEFVILGLGGNCMPQKAFTQGYKGLPGAQCRPGSVLAQYCRLLKTAEQIPAKKRIILVSHVSPLVEPFLELLAWQVGADLTVSGHMGYKSGERGVTDESKLSNLEQVHKKLLQWYPDAEDALKAFVPEAKTHRVQHINLPDAEDGYGELEYRAGEFFCDLRTFA